MKNIETSLLMFIMNLKENKDKKYELYYKIDPKEVYIFKGTQEMYNYFLQYGFDINDYKVKEIINLTIYTHLKNDDVLCFKSLCDYIITKNNLVKVKKDQKLDDYGLSIKKLRFDNRMYI